MRFVSLTLLLVGLVACDSASVPTDAGSDASVPADAGPPPPTTLGPSERPANLVVPNDYDGVTALPAIILLHGFGASGLAQDTYFGLTRQSRLGGFYLVLPNGTSNSAGQRFWNATPVCCDFEDSGVDDVAYLTALIDDLEATVPVLDGGVFFMGHSNGGYMSYRMACERPDRIAGIVPLAGSDFANDDDCVPSQPVSVLHIHGDLDTSVQYEGQAGYPSAPDAVARWAARAGCDTSMLVRGDNLDLDRSVDGEETEVERYEAGCSAAVELWSIRGGVHAPPITRAFVPHVLDWMRANVR